MKTATLRYAVGILALSFAPAWGATNWYFGPGTVSAAAVAESIAGNNIASNNSGNFLVFDDDGIYNANLIGLRNVNTEGIDSAIYVRSGTINLADYLALGCAVNARGTMQIEGGTVNVTNGVNIGNGSGSSGIFTVSGGALTASAFTLGAGTNANAQATLSGGEVTVGSALVLGVAANTTNSLAISGGTVQANLLQTGTTTSATVNAQNSRNTITVNGSGSLTIQTAGQLDNVADSQTTVNVGGNGSLSFGTYLNTGNGAGSSTLINLSGNSQTSIGGRLNFGLNLLSNGLISVADNAALYITSTIGLCQGSMLVSGSASVTTPVEMYLGQATNNKSSLTVSGGSVNVGSNLIVARSNSTSGTISMTGGSITAGGTLSMGQGAGAQSKIGISAGTISAANLYVGAGADSVNVLDISGNASVKISGTATIGQNVRSNNTVRISGGTFEVGSAYFGRTNTVTGLIEQTGGAFIVKNFLNMTYQNNSNTTYSMSGGTFTASLVNMAQQLNSKAIWALSGAAKATVSGNISLGTNTTSQATLSVGDTATLKAGSILLGTGINATASYSQTGGNVTVANFNAAIASKTNDFGNNAIINISGGTLSVASGMRIGVAGSTSGMLDVNYTQTGGEVEANWIAFGANSSSLSAMTVDAALSGGRLVSVKHIDIGANNTDMGSVSANVTVSGTAALQSGNGISVLRGGNLVADRVYVNAAKTASAGEVGTGYLRTTMGGNAVIGTIENISGEVYVQGSSSMTVQNLAVLGAELTQARVGVQSGTMTVANALTLGSSASGTVANANMYVSADGTLRAAPIAVFGGASLAVTGAVSMLSESDITLDSGNNEGLATLALNAGASFENVGNVLLNKNANLRTNLSDAYVAPSLGKSLVFGTADGVLGTQFLTLDFTNLTSPLGDTVLLTVTDTITGFDAWYAYKNTNVAVIGLAEGYKLDALRLGDDGKSLIASIAIPEPAAFTAILGALALAFAARRRR